jgi:hypothetical protein
VDELRPPTTASASGWLASEPRSKTKTVGIDPIPKEQELCRSEFRKFVVVRRCAPRQQREILPIEREILPAAFFERRVARSGLI